MPRDDRMLRPFWLHQVAEYLIGLMLVAVGLQSPDPAVPTVLGGLIVVNAALVDGPVGAFRAVDRRTHRVIDLIVIAVVVAAAIQPWLDVDNATRTMIVVVAVILLVVWWNSSFSAKVPRSAGAPVERSEAIGRGAGRLAGHAAKAIKARQQKMRDET